MSLSGKNKSLQPVFLVFFVTLIYSIVRYHILNDVAWQHLPLYISNKAIALTGLVLLALSLLAKTRHKGGDGAAQQKMYSRSGYFFISLHVLCSMVLLNQDYYTKFFDHGRMNLTGELSMLLGIVAFAIFTFTNFRSWFDTEDDPDPHSKKREANYRNLNQFLVMGHLLVMGSSSWFVPSAWPGYLLPISLIGFLVLLFILPLSLQQSQGTQRSR